MENKKKELAVCYFGLLAMIAFFTPLFSIYDTPSCYFVIIVLTQLLLSRLLWGQGFKTRKNLVAVDSDECIISCYCVSKRSRGVLFWQGNVVSSG